MADQLHARLKSLGTTHAFAVRLVCKANRTQPRVLLPDVVLERIQALWQVTGAVEPRQQAAVLRKLWFSPELLNLLPQTMAAKAAELQRLLGLAPDLWQALLATQPSVLSFRPEALAAKFASLQQLLQLEPPGVQRLWLKQRALINLSQDTLAARLEGMQAQLGLERGALARVVTGAPGLMLLSHEALGARVATLRACLGAWGWPPAALAAALPSYYTVLGYRPETLHRCWQVVTDYAAVHPPSQEALAKRQQSPSMLNCFTRGALAIDVLDFLTQLSAQQAAAAAAASSNSSSTSTSTSTSGTSTSGSEGSSTSSSSRRRGRLRGSRRRAAHAPPAHELPLLFAVLQARRGALEALVNTHWPGFWAWREQQARPAPAAATAGAS